MTHTSLFKFHVSTLRTGCEQFTISVQVEVHTGSGCFNKLVLVDVFSLPDIASNS